LNGITPSISEIGANPSSTLVTTCSTSSTITSSEVSRCSWSTANRGHLGATEKRTESSTPSTTEIVSSTSATAPVARARYQYALGPRLAGR
jgi:hypothetical protein